MLEPFGDAEKLEQQRRARLDAFRAWINQIAKDEGLDITSIARKAGLAPSTLTRPMNNPEYEGNISAKTIVLVSKKFNSKIPKGVKGSSLFRLALSGLESDMITTQMAEMMTGANKTDSLVNGPDENEGDYDRLARAVPVIGRREKAFGRFVYGKGPFPAVARPPELLRSFDAFAVYSTGQQMEPAIKDGSLLFVDPTLPTRGGDYVIMRRHDDELFILEFVSESGSDIIFATYAGGREAHTIPKQDLDWLYKIILVRLP